MEILLGVLALGVAFVSLWISGAAQKGIESQRQQMLTGTRAAVAAHDNAIASLERRLQVIEKAMKAFQNTRVQDAKVLSQLEEQTRSLRTQINEAPMAPPARSRNAG